MIDELRRALTETREELQAMTADADRWKAEYYKMYYKYIDMAADLRSLVGRAGTEE